MCTGLNLFVKRLSDKSIVTCRELLFPFCKQIQAGAQKNSVPCSQTPQELKETYLSGEKADEYLTQLYEKARYAKESVETEEIRKLHELEEQKWKKNGKK